MFSNIFFCSSFHRTLMAKVHFFAYPILVCFNLMRYSLHLLQIYEFTKILLTFYLIDTFMRFRIGSNRYNSKPKNFLDIHDVVSRIYEFLIYTYLKQVIFNSDWLISYKKTVFHESMKQKMSTKIW